MTSAIPAVFADEISIETSSPKIGELCENGLYLISETETVLEDGIVVIDRLYSDIPDSDVNLLATHGTRKFKGTKDFVEKVNKVDTLIVTLTLEASFNWNTTADTVTVIESSIDPHEDVYTNVSVDDKKIEHDDNQGATFFFGYKYAYVRYTVTLKNYAGIKRDYIYIDVNVIGVASQA